MAKVRLSKYEVEKEMLPLVCLKCGDPATVWTKKKFSWSPSWLLVLFLVSPLIMVIVWICVIKRMTVTVPFCDSHEKYFAQRRRTVTLSVLSAILLAVVAIAAGANLEDNPKVAVIAVSLISSVALLIYAAIVSQSTIRPDQITKDDITLIKVAKEFKEALNRERVDDAIAERDRKRKAKAGLSGNRNEHDDDDEYDF